MYDLGRQISQRFKMWKNELPNHLYDPAGNVEFSYFTTFSRLTPDEAEKGPFKPCVPGTAWGDKWEYGWFRGNITLPEACDGRRVVLFAPVGEEMLAYVNGKAIGSIDKGHPYVTLTKCAKAGETCHILIECYAGHGARLETLGPCPPERPAVPPVTGKQCTVGESFIALWNEDAYQLMLDVETLDSLQQILPENSLRALKVAEALDQFTRIADYELPRGPREESFREARKALREALACVNGSTMPTMWMFGQSHIDLGWLWPLEETRRKSVRTYANQLALMEEYPEYRFLLCEPALLDMLMEQDPDTWNRVKEAYQRGQIEPEGAFYVECDTNMPSGESLIRQLMYGKKWFREQFGVESKVAWQPDTFGYSACLPQIFKKLNISYFATEKLLRADPETQRFPYQNFIWEGMDGSTVEALSFFKANAPVNPQLFHRRWETERSQRRNIDTMLYSFGYGDGGGGATRDMLEMIKRLDNLEGAPRAKWGSLKGFFEETARQTAGNRWVGELYLAWHRGTYSVQRRQKAAMRRAEEAIQETEMLLSSLTEKERGPYKEIMENAWKTLMINQFHDIAGGVGIGRVHQEATEALQGIVDTLRPLNDQLWTRTRFIGAGEGYTLINPLPWFRSGWVTLPNGREMYAELLPYESIPADEARLSLIPENRVFLTETEEGFCLKNSFLEAEIDRRGRVTALRTITNGSKRSYLNPGQVMNDWRLYKNVQTVYDAWEMDREWKKGLMPEAVKAEAHISRNTPECAEITVSYAFGESTARQIIRLRPLEKQLTFETEVDWHERRKMLKAHFESNVLSQDAVHEIQFGYVKRPCHRSHPFASDRYEVSNHRYSALCEGNRGFALLNDGLYGLSTDRGEMALTLLRAPLVPDDTCDRGRHRFTYTLYPFGCAFSEADLAKAGKELNVPIRAIKGDCDARKGLSCEGGGVLIDTVKPAEDGNGVILRLYESLGTAAEAQKLTLPQAGRIYRSSMDERETGDLIGQGNMVFISLKPFEIMTLRYIMDK